MDELRMISTTGNIGYGYNEDSLKEGLKLKPHMVGADAGSMDPGPYYLGEGISWVSKAATKRDLRLMLLGAVKNKIPMIIGSAGGSGAEPNLNWTFDIIKEISKEENFSFKIALIHSEPDKDYLINKLKKKKIEPLDQIKPLEFQDIENCKRLVAMMGIEPLIKALKAEADVILAGRCSDSAIFAALPVMKGFPAGLSWHLGKIIECAGAIITPKLGQDCVFGIVEKNSFSVFPTDPTKRCLKSRVAAHTLYENANPYYIHEPSGMIDTCNCNFDQADYNRVKVTGSQFTYSPQYYVKLEGVEEVGYRSICVAGIQDPILISQIDKFLEFVRVKVKSEVEENLKISDTDYALLFRVYGKNGVSGLFSNYFRGNPYELGLIIEVVAKTEEISKAILAKARYATLHSDFEGRMCIAGNLAFPYSPSDISVGRAYRFNIWHIVELDDPCEIFPMDMYDINLGEVTND